MHGSGNTEEHKKPLEEHDILLKGISKTIKNETKEQKGGFLSMLLGTLGASLLGNLLSGKGLYKTCYGIIHNWSLTSFHPFTNFKIIGYFKDVKRFNGVFSRNDLPNLKNRAYAINLDHLKNTGIQWVVIFVKNNEMIYFE